MTLLSDHDMSCGPELRRRLDVLQTRALVAGGAGLALALGGWVLWPRQIFAAYLVGYLFWLGIVLGSLGLTMLHHLVGGSWGLVIRRPLEAGAATVPLMALLIRAGCARHADALSLGAGRSGRARRRSSEGGLLERAVTSWRGRPATSAYGPHSGSCWPGGRAGRTVRATIGRADDFSA